MSNAQKAKLEVTKSPEEFHYYQQDMLDSYRITYASQIIPIEATVTIAGSYFAVKGDISVVGGLPKAGKTAISVFILGTALVPHVPSIMDTLQIKSTFAGNSPVMYIDTEQSPATTDRLRKSIVSLLDIPKEPSNLHIYNLRKMDSPSRKMRFVESLFRRYPNTHLWIIDGLADLIEDPNNTSESFKIVSKFMALSEEHHTSIIFFLHENPGHSAKLRGNLGSEIERKCFGAITIKKDRDKGVHSLEPRMLRGASDFQPIYFRYCRELHRMVSLGEHESENFRKKTDPKQIRVEQLRSLASQCLVGGSERIIYKELANRITNHSKLHLGKQIALNTAKGKIKKMEELAIISKDEDGKYQLCKTEKMQNSGGSSLKSQ